jgi:cob(I)alamin adenosyltransferase
VDETNAALGAVRTLAEPSLERLLLPIQKDLFAIGAQLADPTREVAAKRAKAAVTAARVHRLERVIDAREAKLPPLRSFVMPGGTPAAALLHQARTVCRRAERSVVTLARVADVDPRILIYLNRLSDLLFVLARFENARAGLAEEHW